MGLLFRKLRNNEQMKKLRRKETEKNQEGGMQREKGMKEMQWDS